MRRGLSRLSKRWFRKGQSGQTLVILAFGFIVLLAFVGIVTDVSLMFVRYSSLRRAVDAAAVSAAGQMRRAAPTDDDVNKAVSNCGGCTDQEREQLANGYAFARNVATVNLAARQFIEFYGLSPRNVIVDTCATLGEYDPANPADPALECDPTEQPRKLVRVTAQVNSPTVFLRLIGWGDVLLEATAISETAVLDVVMIFDVSESMANQTSYKDWEAIGQGMRYLPPRMYLPNAEPWDNFPTITLQGYGGHDLASFNQAWSDALGLTQNQMEANALYNSRMFTAQYDAAGNLVDVFQVIDPNATGQPREDCRVRFFPAAAQIPRIPDGSEEYAADNIQQEYTRYMWKYIPGFASIDYPPRGLAAGQSFTDHSRNPPRYDGFMPAYNYYGCCNDPDGNFAFGDLICQPMGLVRDATEDFLDRIDFSRGDRVAFVTFDRSAFLIDPDGTTGGSNGQGQQTHMITSQTNAVEALQNIVGVRAEPNFYADTDANGLWNSYVRGGAPYAGAPDQVIDYEGTTISYNDTPLGGLNEYPVKDNCLFQNATLPYPQSRYASPPNDATPLMDGIFPGRWPTAFAGRFPAYFDSVMLPPLNDPLWNGQVPYNAAITNPDVIQFAKDSVKALYSYEFRAGCRGSNVGAALRVANNALVDPNTIRTSGAVWVMVMLGDGAAAGTDPVKRNGAILTGANPYNDAYNALDADFFNFAAQPGQYGAYGVCPYGIIGALGALVDGDPGSSSPSLQAGWSTAFPYCMDTDPASRHFCFHPGVTDGQGVYIDIGRADCDATYYDADDFARDWADFIGLTDPFPGLVTEDQLNRTDLILPTIFTIGFGLDFNAKANSTDNQERCNANISDCLGEELLRYIADVGDNNQVDTDYQQDLRDNRNVDNSLPAGGFGSRGPCEGPLLGTITDIDLVTNMADIYNPLPVGESCGNYFNAPSPEDLQNVFDTIASRMFTRLTR